MAYVVEEKRTEQFGWEVVSREFETRREALEYLQAMNAEADYHGRYPRRVVAVAAAAE